MRYKYSVQELEKMESSRWMTDRERKVFELYYRRGMEIEEVAAEIYVSRSTVKRCLQSIREKNSNID